MRADRLLSIMLLLQARGRATERELAQRLEVSPRTIHRDLEALSMARVPVVALRGAQGGWELEEGWRTEVPGLDEAELRALLMASPRAVGHPRLAAAAERALEKLMAALPAPMRAQATVMQERLHVDPTGWRETGESLGMLAAVQDAVARERRLAFTYTRADGESAPRTVDPLGMVAKGLSWYLVASTPNGLRTFKVSRMESVTVLAIRFERPAKFKLAAYWERSTAEFKRQGAAYSAVLAVAPEVVARLRGWIEVEVEVETGAAARKAPEGWVTLRVNFDSEEFARFTVLGFGTRVRVLSPQELRMRVRVEAAAVARQENV